MWRDGSFLDIERVGNINEQLAGLVVARVVVREMLDNSRAQGRIDVFAAHVRILSRRLAPLNYGPPTRNECGQIQQLARDLFIATPETRESTPAIPRKPDPISTNHNL